MRYLLGLIINKFCNRVKLLAAILFLFALAAHSAEHQPPIKTDFPKPLESYPAAEGRPLIEILKERAQMEPFNVIASLLFLGAICHTFLSPVFMKMAHHAEEKHRRIIEAEGRTAEARPHIGAKDDVSLKASLLHFLGEVEAIFGLWVIPLFFVMIWSKGWDTSKHFFNHQLNFTEPMFVVVIMSIAASRPVLKLAEDLMEQVARLGRGSAAAWWFSILTVGPLLGSLITEPAAMTICALLLSHKFYDRSPSLKFAYATIGLLFVNVSIGGTLTNFAAPPVLMVAGKWGWGMTHMLTQFGWKAVCAIIVSNIVYFLIFRKEFKRLQPAQDRHGDGKLRWENRDDSIPAWITFVHIAFLGWTVFNSHYPVLFVSGFLFYLAFTQATEHHQNPLRLRPALLVGFFLAGLVIHGGLQGWWIAPVLGSMSEVPLFFGAIALTAFNDNAAITYLASFVPGFTEELKYAVVAGAVVGGGLTVIANAPNPAGQSLLNRYFPNGVAATSLALGAAIPTAIAAAFYLLL